MTTEATGLADTAPPGRRRSRAGLAAVLVVVVVAAGAFVVGSRLKSPRQAAATAAAPAPTQLTVAVTRRVLTKDTVFRVDVGAATPLSVPVPVLPGGALPIVTAVGKHPGDPVAAATVLAAVAGRPVIVLPGAIPAYRTLEPGDTGGDVTQLQVALRSVGYGTGGDRRGTYGQGTSRAVTRLYARAGYPPVQVPDTSTSDTPAAGTSTPAAAAGNTGMPSDPTATTVAAAPTPTPATTSPAAPTTTVAAMESTVPLGEVLFVPTLPVTVATSALVVGQPVPQASGSGGAAASSGSGASSAPATGPLMTLGSGGAIATGQIDANQGQLLRPGMAATLDDDTSGGTWSATVTSVAVASADANGVPQATVVVTPAAAAPLPAAEMGQNIRVTVHAASTDQPVLVVPISAVFSRADGTSSVTVVRHGRDVTVGVAVGIDSSGYVQITPRTGNQLATGERVLVGSSSPGGS